MPRRLLPRGDTPVTADAAVVTHLLASSAAMASDSSLEHTLNSRHAHRIRHNDTGARRDALFMICRRD